MTKKWGTKMFKASEMLGIENFDNFQQRMELEHALIKSQGENLKLLRVVEHQARAIEDLTAYQLLKS